MILGIIGGYGYIIYIAVTGWGDWFVMIGEKSQKRPVLWIYVEIVSIPLYIFYAIIARIFFQKNKK